MTYKLEALNKMNREQFVHAIGWVYEHSPWVMERTWEKRPFDSISSLHSVSESVVRLSAKEDALNLIRAHPDLAGKLKMTDASVREQAGAGLNELTAEEFEAFSACNRAYVDKFEFPFILAVRGKRKEEIWASMKERLEHDAETEFQRALQEISRISRFRLEDTVTE